MRKNGLIGVFAAMLFLMCATQMRAETLFVEGGRFASIFAAPGRQATFGAISIEGDGGVFPVLSFGMFVREYEEVAFCSIGIGTRRTISENLYGGGRASTAFISNATDRLGTRLQFNLVVFVGFRKSDIDFRIGFQHFSNGSNIFGTKEPNKGEEFITIGIGTNF